MSFEVAGGLRALADALPAGAAVPVPREWLLELLGAASDSIAPLPADPTVEEVALRFGRAPSTVRGWCEAGRFPGAYKLHHREWRIPLAGLEAFEAEARRGERPAGVRRRALSSLSDSRHVS